MPAFEKRESQNNTKKGYIVAIIILSLALVGTNLLTYFGIWQKIIPETSPIFPLGKQATIDISLNSANALSFNFKGSAVNGVFYNQVVSLKMPITQNKFLIRAKAGVDTERAQYPCQIANDSNWIVGEDGYYYLSSFAISGQKINLANGIILPKFEANQQKAYTLTFVVESLQADFDYYNIWNLPQDFQLNDTIS